MWSLVIVVVPLLSESRIPARPLVARWPHFGHSRPALLILPQVEHRVGNPYLAADIAGGVHCSARRSACDPMAPSKYRDLVPLILVHLEAWQRPSRWLLYLRLLTPAEYQEEIFVTEVGVGKEAKDNNSIAKIATPLSPVPPRRHRATVGGVALVVSVAARSKDTVV